MYNVLIVDDEPFILEGIERIINWADMGMEVVGKVLDGFEALKQLEIKNVSIIITDIKMPNMDGIELIKQVKAKGLSCRFIILSGYNDFEYVKEGIKLGIENYLLKPVNTEELNSTLADIVVKIENDLYQKINHRKDMNILKQNILNRWVTNNISPEELLERSSVIDVNLDCAEYAVSVVKILTDAQCLEQYENDAALVSYAVFNVCNEIINGSGLGMAFCDIHGDVIIIFMGELLNKSSMNNLLMSCINNTNKFLHVDIFITIGEIKNCFESVHISYNEAFNLQNYYLVMQKNSILEVEKARSTYLHPLSMNGISFECLTNILKTKNNEQIQQFIEETFKGQELSLLTRQYVQNTAIEILLYMTVFIKDNLPAFYTKFEILKNTYLNSLSIYSLDDVKQWIENVLSQTVEFLLSEEANANPLIKQVLNFINTNYHKDVSIKALSFQFNVNAAYFGQLFKKETGKLFTDYVNEIRIEKAKVLLASTKMKVATICEKVGYIDDNNFFRSFKKITGMSPSDYRNNINRAKLE